MYIPMKAETLDRYFCLSRSQVVGHERRRLICLLFIQRYIYDRQWDELGANLIDLNRRSYISLDRGQYPGLLNDDEPNSF